ncbi:MAG: LytTR family transcriptional regulator [Rhodobacteraceae bacterium]|jgi:hypothetical protein|nr:LytTR family transcriptional regulator [Paracoccaceae bacterium]
MTTQQEPTGQTETLHLLRGSHDWAVNRFGQYLRSARFWVALIASILVSAVAGPFNTLAYMGFGTRLVYWLALLLPAVFLQFYLSMILREFARRTDRPWGLAALAAGLLGAVVILGWVQVIDEFIVLEAQVFTFSQEAFFVITVVVSMTMLINAFMPTLQPLWGMRRRARRLPAIAAALPDTSLSPFFDRLPADLGRDVICIRAANHHIEVTTTRGHARVLMRLADAEADLADLPGMRVHRSWWVNLGQVATTESRQGGLDLILTSGTRVPVSRALRAAVQARLELTDQR